jgi:hypothetical protein
MKKLTFLLSSVLLYLCCSCSMPKYIPVESVKMEYRDNYIRDSIYRYDSIYVKEKGDTLIFERYRYLYRDKFIRDSVFICDTIRVSHPVEVVKVKTVKAKRSSWVNFQIWCGRFALAVVLFIVLYYVIIRKRI